MKKCNKCGAILDDEALFCSECGTKLEPAEKKCHNCGAVLSEGAKFCMNCGTPVVQAVVPPTLTSSPNKQESAEFEASQPDENTLSFNIKGISFNMKYIKGGMLGKDEISDYYIGETVVTQALWQTIVGDNPSKDNSDINYPVTDIESNNVKAFLTRLKKIIGIAFNIPTGSQFKYAALKGSEKMSSAEFDEMMWGDDKMHPVCGMMPNHFGLYDLRELKQAVQDQVPDKPNKTDNYYRFNPKYNEGEYGASLESFEKVDFSKKFSTLRLVINIPVDPKLEQVKKERENSEAIERSHLFRIRRNGKWGFIDRTGEIVIPCKYDYADDFSEGLAHIERGTNPMSGIKYGFIDIKGNKIVPYEYDHAGSFSEGLAWVEKDSRYGFINETGKVAISCQFDKAEDFHEGLAPVYVGSERASGVAIKGEWIFIDKTGKKVFSCKYDYVDGFNEGLAMVGKDSKYGFIDKTGKEVIPFKYSEAMSFHEGLACVAKGGKYGYIDQTGKEVIPFKYSDAMSFHEGLACVVKGGKYGFIDKTGKEVIPFKYSDAMSFHEGLACVAKDGKFGYIDKTGNEVISCKFEYDSDWDSLKDVEDDFHNGLAYIRDEDDDQWVYIDTTGTKIDVIGLEENK